MVFLFASIAFNVAQVFGFVFFFLNNLNSINASGQIALLVTSITFIVLRDLVLRLTHINKQEVMGLSFVFVFVPILVLLIGFVFLFFG